MNNALIDQVILVVEDELMIALDLEQLFQSAGAQVVQARTLLDALHVVRQGTVSAAVVDHGLMDGLSTELCLYLKEKNIPFMIYSGYSVAYKQIPEAVLIEKPASLELLMSTMIGLLETGAPPTEPEPRE